MRRFRRVAVLVPALALAACQESAAPITDLDALQLSVSVSPATVTAGIGRTAGSTGSRGSRSPWGWRSWRPGSDEPTSQPEVLCSLSVRLWWSFPV